MLRCMRTTLTLDDDVAALLERARRRRRVTFKEIVNSALREGLSRLEEPVAARPFRTRAVSLGPSLVGDLDDVAGILATLEDDRRS